MTTKVKSISPTQLYHDLNRQFFNGRLPRFRVVLCFLHGSLHGECLPERRLIRLDRSLDPERMRRTLLHEMCHIGSLGHGTRFQNKLLRLATQGEKWAREEAEQYRTHPGLGTALADLRKTLDDVAFIQPRPRFPSLLRWLSRDWGRRPKELLRIAPWLEDAWTKACNEADDERRLRERLAKKYANERRRQK